MKALSLFSGCGGLDLAAELAGIEVAGQCEIDEACNKVLRHWWPDAPRWKDVQDVTAKELRKRCGAIDMVFGGPPCQPVSLAGRREAAGDKRNMWPEFIRIIRDTRPRWVVAENPPGIISAQKYKGDEREWPKGEFFGEIVRDIAALGYNVGWGVWGACDVEAPHKRDRVFIVAYHPGVGRCAWRPEQPGQQGVCKSGGSGSGELAHASSVIGRPLLSWGGRRGFTDSSFVGNPASGSLRNDRQNDWPSDREIHAFADSGVCGGNEVLGNTERKRPLCDRIQKSALHLQPDRDRRSAQPCMGGMFDGVSPGMDFPGWPAGRGQEQYSWEPPRVVPGKSIIGRTAMIKMLGNAVVPQQAVILFREILELENALLQPFSILNTG